MILVEAPSSLGYLLENLKIEEEDRLSEVMSSEEMITLVSDGGLKEEDRFGWVASHNSLWYT